MIKINVSGKDKSVVFQAMQKRFTEESCTLSGNADSGTFCGRGIEGSYILKNEELLVKITKKPFFIPESMIESELRKFLTDH